MKFNPFQHFSIRPDKGEISALELSNGISLPPLFKVFNETFVLDSFQQPNREGYWIVHPNPLTGFDDFSISIEFTIKNYLAQYAGNAGLDGFLPFASSGMHAFGICVGLRDPFVDKVCLHFSSKDSDMTIINNNIFEFVQDLVYVNHQNDQTYANTHYKF